MWMRRARHVGASWPSVMAFFVLPVLLLVCGVSGSLSRRRSNSAILLSMPSNLLSTLSFLALALPISALISPNCVPTPYMSSILANGATIRRIIIMSMCAILNVSPMVSTWQCWMKLSVSVEMEM